MPRVMTTPPSVRTVVPRKGVLSKTPANNAATARKTMPATSDWRPLATRGGRNVVSRPTARMRTEGRVTRAMKRKTMGRAKVMSGTRSCGACGRT